ncbi:MAG: hypothetical protein ABSG15_00565 [FCB group bacterium]|jgi:hypothetical protein
MKNTTSLETIKRNYILIPRPQEAENELKSIFKKVLNELNNEKLINSDIKADLNYLIDDYFESLNSMEEVADCYHSDEFTDDDELI